MSLIISQSTIYELLFFLIFAFAFLVQLFYYLLVYIRVPLKRRKNRWLEQDELPGVSVVICAKNEEENLERFLPSILEQNYPQFEVIVVNDCSSDNTELLLNRFKQKYHNLRTTALNQDAKFSHGKKLALTVGIKAAKYDWLLLTDADCKAESDRWIATMASNFLHPNQVVLGYGGYLPQRGFLNKIIRFDTFFIALQYLSYAMIGAPYMGVGRNLAYRKELFFKAKGFSSHSFLDSGDDDLFIHQVANKKNTTTEISHSAHTHSIPSGTWFEWFAQKSRHLSTSPYYRSSIKFGLAFEPLSRLLFWISGISLLGLSFFPVIVLSIIAFRLIVISIILNIAMNRLNEKKIFIISLIYDFFSPFLFGTLMLANSLKIKQSKWS